MLSRMQRFWGDSPFYQAKLSGPAPDRVLFKPEDPFAPDRNIAQSIAAGRLTIGDETIDCDGDLATIWDRADAGGAAAIFLQRFSWLRDLQAIGEAGCPVARALMLGWLDRYEKWAPEAWAPYFVAERLLQLCAHHSLLLQGGDALWRSRVLSSMARQTRHLANVAHRAGTDVDRLILALGLCIAGHSLPGCETAAARGLEMTRRELRLQMRADGGHVSRDPSRQLNLAIRIQTALNAVEANGRQAPGFLRHAMVRAGAMAAFFRCADGKLAVFNGGYEDDPRAVLAIEKSIDPDSALTGFARHSCYHKLTAGRALLIADTGADLGPQLFRSAGSFHFSSGRSRIIGNCGSGEHRAANWRNALMQREAHSSFAFDAGPGRAPSFGEISHRRAEDARGLLVEIERMLLADTVPATWTRRLFLAPGGADLRGEECLEGLPAALSDRGVWRFHLHPSVKASLARDKKSVLLLLPNKEGWRFKSNSESLELEKSVYCGGGESPVAAEQIVMRAAAAPPGAGDSVFAKWALRRLDAA